jgi:hypothetical protein
MKLGGKSKDVDSFVDQLKSEGETVVADATTANRNAAKTLAPALPQIKTERSFSFSVFVERRSTIERTHQPPPQNVALILAQQKCPLSVARNARNTINRIK